MKKKTTKNRKKFRLRPLLIIGLVVLFVIIYFLISNNYQSEKAFETSPEPTIYSTIKPSPTSLSIIKPSITSAPLSPTNKPVDWQSLTIPEDQLITAVNNYRQAQGVSKLNINEGLCQEARKRAQDLTNQNIGRWPPFILEHKPFLKDVNDGTLGKLSGLTMFGENVASSNCKKLTDGGDVFINNATQLVEECFSSSSEHRDNMLRFDWTHICSSGRYPFYVQIFGR